jgi:hypothetical protein
MKAANNNHENVFNSIKTVLVSVSWAVQLSLDNFIIFAQKREIFRSYKQR